MEFLLFLLLFWAIRETLEGVQPNDAFRIASRQMRAQGIDTGVFVFVLYLHKRPQRRRGGGTLRFLALRPRSHPQHTKGLPTFTLYSFAK
jgi:hypothetical protein